MGFADGLLLRLVVRDDTGTPRRVRAGALAVGLPPLASAWRSRVLVSSWCHAWASLIWVPLWIMLLRGDLMWGLVPAMLLWPLLRLELLRVGWWKTVRPLLLSSGCCAACGAQTAAGPDARLRCMVCESVWSLGDRPERPPVSRYWAFSLCVMTLAVALMIGSFPGDSTDPARHIGAVVIVGIMLALAVVNVTSTLRLERLTRESPESPLGRVDWSASERTYWSVTAPSAVVGSIVAAALGMAWFGRGALQSGEDAPTGAVALFLVLGMVAAGAAAVVVIWRTISGEPCVRCGDRSHGRPCGVCGLMHARRGGRASLRPLW